MVWQNEMVRLLRHLVNDLDESSPTYSEDRLEEVIIVAAQFLIEEVDFEQTYTVDVDTHTITPDPTLTTAKDDSFVNLVALKAAVLILWAEVKTASSQAYAVVDGPSRIDVREVFKAKKALYDAIKDAFDKAVLDYKMGRSIGGQVITTPYTVTQVNSRYTIF